MKSEIRTRGRERDEESFEAEEWRKGRECQVERWIAEGKSYWMSCQVKNDHGNTFHFYPYFLRLSSSHRMPIFISQLHTTYIPLLISLSSSHPPIWSSSFSFVLFFPSPTLFLLTIHAHPSPSPSEPIPIMLKTARSVSIWCDSLGCETWHLDALGHVTTPWSPFPSPWLKFVYRPEGGNFFCCRSGIHRRVNTKWLQSSCG